MAIFPSLKSKEEMVTQLAHPQHFANSLLKTVKTIVYIGQTGWKTCLQETAFYEIASKLV
jgi:hypothetical protein